jgi:hypothetical protein
VLTEIGSFEEITLATKTVIMRGTISCRAPVVSMTITVVVSVILVAPPMKAAAPICTSIHTLKYVRQISTCNVKLR